ncbi:MAG: peptidoglycan-binding protein [Burkholderiaceae bacterium]
MTSRPSPDPAPTSVLARRPGAAAPGPVRLGRAVVGEHFVLGARACIAPATRFRPGAISHRPLQVYALDPSASASDGAEAVVRPDYEPLEPIPGGFRGGILEINDPGPSWEDDPSGSLDDPFVLMNQGLAPSPERPAFRRQMAYAVCHLTYEAFRQSLGRELGWGFCRAGRESTNARLKICTCVPGLCNAYYEPERGEIRVGSFEAGAVVSGRNVPGGKVSLALSHDVLVHEMSHALLDGLRAHFLYPSNPDVLAFHEGFADLIALLQRFTYPDIVSRAVRASRGQIWTSTLLKNIAVQFAETTTGGNALRSAFSDEQRRYEDTPDAHLRGQILVSTVFTAFERIYQRRTQSLLQLASAGTGILPEGEIPELLVARLSQQACKLAAQFLSMCIRAIDYCPPVDITFGEFLRAVITADRDLVPVDDWNYREAWVEAFAARRIYPTGVDSLSDDALTWAGPDSPLPPEPDLRFSSLRFDGDPSRAADEDEMRRQAEAFGQLAADPLYREVFGLARPGDPRLSGDEVFLPVIESLRSSRRVSPDGSVLYDLIGEVVQRRAVRGDDGCPGFDFFGGATVVLGPDGVVRYIVRKSIFDTVRLAAQCHFVSGRGSVYFGSAPGQTVQPLSSLLLSLHEITRPLLRSSAATRALAGAVKDAPESALAEDFLLKPGDRQAWIPILKRYLTNCLSPAPVLADTPLYDAATEQAVRDFQTRMGATVDGLTGPATWALLGQAGRRSGLALPAAGSMPDWILSLLRHDAAQARLDSLDVESAIRLTVYSFGALTSGPRQGLTFLLQQLKQDGAITDLRWAAYMLATVRHECANTWQPIEEIGKGAGQAYGRPELVTDDDGRRLTNVYYGRGFVQLTWKENYEWVGRNIGLDRELLLHPDRALEPDVAYTILSDGMRKGFFTTRTLSRYINQTSADYFNARRIINGLDQAARIQAYAERFEIALLASLG